MANSPVDVFITVDTEAWPHTPGWRESRLTEDIQRCIYGRTPKGDFGIEFQLRLLEKYNLKASFFVETLSASVVGLDRLESVVAAVQRYGQEVQLHVHSEWLRRMEPSILPGRTGQHLRMFTAGEQFTIIGQARDNLRAAGVDPCAFRAGSYGANFDTLHALRQLGIRFDTSYNYPYLNAACGLSTPEPLLQPVELNGVMEYPISFFQDWPGHFRHAQLCACSFAELETALLQASERGWSSFVIVSHSFELLNDHNSNERVRPSRIAIRRFEKLLQFLSRHKDRFRTAHFRDLPQTPQVPAQTAPGLRGSVLNTIGRVGEQAIARLL